MTWKNILSLFGCLLGSTLLLTLTARAQNTPIKPSDPEQARVEGMVQQARKESEEFSKSGGKASDATNPNVKWAATLWRYRGEHAGTPANVTATAEALRMLVRADQII